MTHSALSRSVDRPRPAPAPRGIDPSWTLTAGLPGRGGVVVLHGPPTAREKPSEALARVLASHRVSVVELRVAAPAHDDRADPDEVESLESRIGDEALAAGAALADVMGPRGGGIGVYASGLAAAAVLRAAADPDAPFSALALRSVPFTLVWHTLAATTIPVLLLVGSYEQPAVDFHRLALAALGERARLTILPRAGAEGTDPPDAEYTAAHDVYAWFASHRGTPARRARPRRSVRQPM